MPRITIYSEHDSPRLRYVLDWLFTDQLGCSYDLVQQEKDIPHGSFFISYGRHFINAFSIPDAGLLWQKEIKQHTINTGTWYDIPTLYAVKDDNYTLPFDILSALFFLLSRYEEYYSFTPDKYGRYPATESILFKNKWLQQPVVDEWVQQLRILLQQQYDVAVTPPSFSYQPSYDIDIAYSYLHKGYVRTIGAFAKNLLAANTSMMAERTAVLLNKKKDPYDSFGFLAALHNEVNCTPLYFILSALKTSAYDKNIHPAHPQMSALIKSLSKEGTVGIHPSYFSYVGHVMQKEKATLENIILQDIRISRQHYIKIKNPDTYYALIANGITDDYSMGYGTHLGFRAGTGSAFYWYDLKKETATSLRIHPFCFMDSTALFEEKLSANTAFEKLHQMATRLKNTNSRLMTVFHNFSLGTAPEWKGWSGQYKNFVQEIF